MRSADFEPRHPPAGIAIDDLYVTVAPLSATTSGIGVSTEVVAQPPRTAKDTLPSGRVEVSVGATYRDGAGRLGTIHVTPTPHEARQVATRFDRLQIDVRTGPRHCPLMTFGERFPYAKFIARGHTWVIGAGSCGFTGLSRDGRRLPGFADGGLGALLEDVLVVHGVATLPGRTPSAAASPE